MVEWTSLSEFAMQLEIYDRISNNITWRNYSELTSNATRSGAVPVRGVAEGQHEQQRIERYITHEADIEVMFNRISVASEKVKTQFMNGPLFPVARSSFARRACFEQVQIDKGKAQEWLRENSDYTPMRSKRLPGPKAKKDAFIKWWESEGKDMTLSHKQIAGMLGVNVRTVSNWFNWLKNK
jgi:hypothetical protein